MTKKLLALLLAVLTFATLTACKKEKDDPDDMDRFKSQEVIYTSYTDADGNTFRFETLDSDTVAITGYSGSDLPHAITIPSSVKTGDDEATRKDVVAIAKSAFASISALTSVTIPEGITTIDDYAFSGCKQLTSVSLPSTLETLGASSFYGCGLTSLELPAACKLTELPKLCFAGCTALTEVTIPAYIKTVGEAAFFECTGLNIVTISEGVETVGKQAFQGTVKLERLTLPSTLTNTDPMTDLAFYGSKLLTRNNIVCPVGSAAKAYANLMPVPETDYIGEADNA